jgi:hypothetical protein
MAKRVSGGRRRTLREQGEHPGKPSGRTLRISSAPPPPTPLPVSRAIPEATHTLAETSWVNHPALFEFHEALRQCNEAHIKGRNIKRVDSNSWEYWSKRRAEILRPALRDAFDKCEVSGMPANELAKCRHQMNRCDKEWMLVSEMRKSSSPKGTRGRPAEYDWDGVRSELNRYVTKHGLMRSKNELIQKCSAIAAGLHPEQKTPDEKTVRAAIKKHGLLEFVRGRGK